MIGKLLNSAKLETFRGVVSEESSILIEGLWDAPKAVLTSLIQCVTKKHVLIVIGGAQEERRLYDDITFFRGDAIMDFPAWETLPSERMPPSPDVVGGRYNVLNEILFSEKPQVIICNVHALLQKVIRPLRFQELCLDFYVGEEKKFEGIIAKLDAMGYKHCAVASDKGEFAVRGGIVDVFSVSSPDPLRVEFCGDKIKSIRIYDPVGQKSVRNVEKFSIMPALEMELLSNENDPVTILDYLGTETCIVFDNILDIEDHYISLESIPGTVSRTFGSFHGFLERVSDHQKVFMAPTYIEKFGDMKVLDGGKRNLYSESVNSYSVSFEAFGRKIVAERWLHPFVMLGTFFGDFGENIFEAAEANPQACENVCFVSSTEAEEQFFRSNIPESMNPTFERGYLSSGFVITDTLYSVVPYAEVTRRYKIRRPKMRSTYHTVPTDVYHLTPGDIVVHFNNGIGKYIGTDRRPNHIGIDTEFFIIEYAKGTKLYVPYTQSHLVSKYIGATDDIPRFSTLGGNRWQKVRTQTERSILGYASDLLKMYAERSIKGGLLYPEDSSDTRKFEDDFPFVETEDQVLVMADIKKDMMSREAMDRLICGDVGYGKTEVAMRTAFKAVADGDKQVAVLVPTTVLAMQHYDTFKERMYNFPINVGVLSRFRSPKQIKETLQGIKDGTVDILIGTHRIISDDVVFKDLGLVIIDEEQRFGVRVKEKLRAVKVGVDCLALTATPIPRTLYLSMIGARDMSLINTPPQDRLPTKTVVCERDENVFRNAILRELARDGQVFIIHNRVETIYDVADMVKKLLPQVRLLVAHGQMHADELDMVFHSFKKADADILVATTIVENGVDIPNANTIIVDRADQFGLSDLYQLRGRVGRWNRQSYSYFLVPKDRRLSEMASKRLEAIGQSGGHGGGMRIAMRDLEIRGAGDILGTEQSGQVSVIGFHLYCKLLKRTVDSLQGKVPSIVTETKMEFSFDARLPDEYINESSLRMEIYQRLGEAMNWKDVDDVIEEVRDRFGPLSKPVEWLYHLTRIRVFASLNHFTVLTMKKYSLSAEQRCGKKTVSKNMLVNPVKDPKKFENNVVAVLRSNFKIVV